MGLENPKSPKAKPSLAQRLGLKEQVDLGLFDKAENLLTNPTFLAKLGPKNLASFVQARFKEKYAGYRAWNKQLMEDVLGLKDVSPAEQKVRTMACQIFLDQKIGGFTKQLKRRNSIDGMCGPYTVSKMNEYVTSLQKDQPQQPSPQPIIIPTRAPDIITTSTKSPHVLSRLPEGMQFDKEDIFYGGDSYMVGICGGKRVDKKHKIVKVGAQLVRYIKPRALQLLESPNCKMLVVNGGINDLYSRGASKRVIDEIIDTYTTIINEAHQKGIKVTIYNLNGDVAPPWHSEKMIGNVKVAADRINQWIATQSGADVIVNSSSIINDRLSKKDRLHPTGRAYADLHRNLKEVIQV